MCEVEAHGLLEHLRNYEVEAHKVLDLGAMFNSLDDAVELGDIGVAHYQLNLQWFA
jgi:hypothetical protein